MRSYRFGWLTVRGGAGVMAVLAVVGALLLGLARGVTTDHLLLTPGLVLRHLEVWQVVTWLFVPQPTPMSVIFGVLLLISLGSELEGQWGTARLWRVVLGVGVSVGVLTVLLSLLLSPLDGLSFTGLQTTTLVLWIAYGLGFRRSTIRFWSLPVTGYTFAAIGVAFSLLSGLFGSWLAIIPDLLAAGLTFLVVHEAFPGGLWTRFRSWQLERDLKRRSAHLKSLDGGRASGRGSDRFLH